MTGALERKQRETPPVIKIDGEAEARIIALSAGRCRWTLKLIADKAVELEIFDRISATAIGHTLKKTKLNPWRHKMWRIPQAGPPGILSAGTSPPLMPALNSSASIRLFSLFGVLHLY